MPAAADGHSCRNHKGFLSQNCLVVCSFDFQFLYVLSGWEGSAADSTVFHDARQIDFPVLPGHFYLADAGYPSCDELLVPYRGQRYHLAEWKRTALRSVILSGEPPLRLPLTVFHFLLYVFLISITVPTLTFYVYII